MDSVTKHLASPVRDTGDWSPCPCWSRTESQSGWEGGRHLCLPAGPLPGLPAPGAAPACRPGPSTLTARGGAGVQAAWALCSPTWSRILVLRDAQTRSGPAGRKPLPPCGANLPGAFRPRLLLRAPRQWGFAPCDSEAEALWPEKQGTHSNVSVQVTWHDGVDLEPERSSCHSGLSSASSLNLKACLSPNPEGSWPLSPCSLLLECLLSSFTSVPLFHVFISFSSALRLNNFLENYFYSGKFCFFFSNLRDLF